LLITIILAVLIALICAIYPGPEFINALVDIPVFQLLFGGITDVENPRLLIWVLLILGIFSNIIFPVMGILFGVRILPFNEKDGKELIFSTEKSSLWYFLENLLLVIVLIPLIVIPAYLVGVGFLIGGGGGILPYTIAFILPLFFTIVVITISSLGCAIWSSTKTGYAFGGIFFIVSFTLDILQQELDFVTDINLMTQSNTFMHALDGTLNEEFILKCLVLSLLLVILTIFFLYRTDYIQTRSSYNETTDKKSRGIISKFLFIKTPIESILSRVGWKFPAFRDQLQSTAGVFLIYSVITSALLALVALVYPGDVAMAAVFSEMDVVFDSPIIAAFLFGHELTPTLEGFLLYKIMVFHWVYYAPFIFIMTNSIMMRDKNADYDEITWSLPRTRTRIIIQRTIAVLVYLWIIMIINFVVLYLCEIILGTYADIVLTDFGATALTFIYLGIGYSIFLILFVSLASIPRPKYLSMTLIGTFLIALFIPIIWYLNQDLTWLPYLSPFYYFDVAGTFLNDILLEKVVPETIAYGAIVIAFFLSVVKFWVPTRDIT
jgi:ABC-2 type transport system permease protein